MINITFLRLRRPDISSNEYSMIVLLSININMQRAMKMVPKDVEYKIVYSRFLNNMKEDHYGAEAMPIQALAQPHSPGMNYSFTIHSTMSMVDWVTMARKANAPLIGQIRGR